MSSPYPSPFTLLPDTVHFKEFYGGFNGTCGETAVTAAIICALRLGDTHDQAVQMMLDVTHQMQAAGWASANGASTLWALAREAIVRHATIALEYDYQEPLAQDWHAVLLANAGIRPIVLQVGLAYNLVGQDNSGNDEAGVHYHFITVVGRCPDGYICMDGDNWKIEQQLAIYSYATLQAADICGLLMLEESAVPTVSGIPTNWKDDGTTLVAPNGIPVVRGFRDYILANSWGADNVPLEPEREYTPLVDSNTSFGDGVGQQFSGARLIWQPGPNKIWCIVNGLGEDILLLRVAVAVAKAAEAAAVATDAADKKALADAEAIIAGLKGTKTDPAIVAALDAAAQYLGVPAQLASEVAAAQSKVVR